MTQEQFNFLACHQGSLKEFVKALGKLIRNLDLSATIALYVLSYGLDAKPIPLPAAEDLESARAIDPPKLGCCSFDGERQNTSQYTCEQGLQGTWDPKPCYKGKPPKEEEQLPRARGGGK
jgi:hypothetical protein